MATQLSLGATLQGGKYVIKKVLGQGGFGITYLAEQTMLGKRFAIKEFFIRDLCTRLDNYTVTATAQSDMVKRYHQKFIKEAQIIARFEHPGIVHVNDIFEENGTAYYVMNYVEGENLDEIIKREGALTEERALGYITKVADALDYIHRHNVNHLDIKPANIMIRKADNEPILIDFGVSKQYDEHKDQTTTTPPGVSNGYSPLEQYKPGGVSTFSPQADIYALGATLYKMMTGKTPPSASDILNDDLPEMPGYISSNVKKAIKKAMEPRRVDRPKSILDFKEMLGLNVVRKTQKDFKPPIKIEKDLQDDGTILAEKPGNNMELDPIIKNLLSNMVFIEGGDYWMGATNEQEYEAGNDENPVHKVNLSPFYISRYEITQEEWETVMGNNPSFFKGEKLPVENVRWSDCKAFIEKLNLMTGKRFRLPTEAEWEYAARSGKYNQTCRYKYSGNFDIDKVAWYNKNSGKTTHPVGQKSPNKLGLYDMSGNVSEWCEDFYGLYNSFFQKDPKGPKTGLSHIHRGGGWNENASFCRVSYRGCNPPTIKYSGIGFRLALDSSQM